jgi:hypothetical protein
VMLADGFFAARLENDLCHACSVKLEQYPAGIIRPVKQGANRRADIDLKALTLLG